jgi:cytochrome c-type biogenesis protein
MNAKRIMAAILLLFSAVSLCAAIVKHVRSRNSAGADQAPPRDGAVVYYLHQTWRCEACNTVEDTLKELVGTEFKDEVEAGRMQLRIANYMEDSALAAKFNPEGPMVIVVRYADGKEQSKPVKLDQALEIASQPERLKDYLRQGILQGAPERNMEMVFWAALAAAFGFGLLTAVSPCPLATNIAAISFLGRSASQPRKVLLSGLAYTLGRTVVYVVLGVLIIWALRQPWSGGGNGASISRFLQTYGGMILGPALIIAGMVLLQLLQWSRSLNLGSQGLQKKAAAGGIGWAFVLGVLFALSFCPISAMIFFGTMITLATANQSMVLLPSAFGVATAVPVLIFAFLIAFASRYIGKAFNRMTQIDRWLRLIAGIVFVAAGIFYSFAHLGLISLGGR